MSRRIGTMVETKCDTCGHESMPDDINIDVGFQSPAEACTFGHHVQA
jgi:hypothetical protein